MANLSEIGRLLRGLRTIARPERAAGLLQPLLRHAFANVPFYRSRFLEAGLREADFRGEVPLKALPIISREEVQAAERSEIVAAGFDADRLLEFETSGSSGKPLVVLRTVLEDRLLNAVRLRRYFGLGLRLHERRAAMVYSELSARDAPEPKLRPVLGALGRSAIHYRESPRGVISQLLRIRPEFFQGYPGVLCEIGAHVTESEREAMGVRMMACGGETLTAEARRRIESAFGARLYDCYGTNEFNLAASECATTGLMHLQSDSCAAEVIGGERVVEPGERGELVLTALHSYAMPFIRYRTGDQVVRGPDTCPCGAAVPTLESLEGRTAEHFSDPQGNLIHPFEIEGKLTPYIAPILRYQIEQTSLESIELRIVLSDDSARARVDPLRNEYGDYEARGVRVSVVYVDELRAEPGGKFKTFVPLRKS